MREFHGSKPKLPFLSSDVHEIFKIWAFFELKINPKQSDLAKNRPKKTTSPLKSSEPLRKLATNRKNKLKYTPVRC